MLAVAISPPFTCQWSEDFLSRGWAGIGTNNSAVARVSFIVTRVRYTLSIAGGPISFGGSGLPRVRSFRRAAARQIQIHVRNIAEVIDKFTQTLGLKKYALYVNDYGGPIGFRLALAHPERVTAIVVQNAVAHNDGLDEKRWAGPRAFCADRAKYEDQFRQRLTVLQGAKARHIGTSPHPERYSPDLWDDEFAHLSRPGIAQIQVELFYDYRTNVEAYPVWQNYLRNYKPPTLVITIPVSLCQRPRLTSARCRTPKFMSSRLGTSRWMKRSMK